MTHSAARKAGLTAALLASSVLLTAAWGVPAGADGGGNQGGVFKFIGASYTQELKFASCMRRHGELNFPDPNSKGFFVVEGIDLNSHQYLRAQTACQYLMPKGRALSPAEQEKIFKEALRFAACMRSHGVANFPDPSSQGGGITFSIRGVDPDSPQYQRAVRTCQKLSPSGAFGQGAPFAAAG
jgi:hypothetical protein